MELTCQVAVKHRHRAVSELEQPGWKPDASAATIREHDPK